MHGPVSPRSLEALQPAAARPQIARNAAARVRQRSRAAPARSLTAAAAPRPLPLAPPSAPSHGGSRSSGSRRTATLQAHPLGLVAEATVLYEPTGVPLVDELMKLPSLAAAVQRSLHLLLLLGGVAACGSLLLRALDSEAGRRIRERGEAHFNIGAALLASAAKPCQVMLPLFCATRAATVVLALAEVAATKLNGQLTAALAGSLSGRWAAAANWLVLAAGGSNGSTGGGSSAAALLGMLQWTTQLIQDCSELVAIITVAWAAIDFKNRAMRLWTTRLQTDRDPFNDGLVPLLRLLSTGLSILVALAATGVALVGFGFHIGPLMASIGGLGVVLGLATQDLLQNLTAAVSLYVTRPFVAGDHVKLINQEGVEVEGTVINIEPTRTILRDTHNRCIVHLANSEVAQFIIMNRTQCQTLSRLQELQAQTGGAGYAIRTLPELAMAMRSADVLSDSESDGEEAGGAPGNGTAAAPAVQAGPAFAG